MTSNLTTTGIKFIAGGTCSCEGSEHSDYIIIDKIDAYYNCYTACCDNMYQLNGIYYRRHGGKWTYEVGIMAGTMRPFVC